MKTEVYIKIKRRISFYALTITVLIVVLLLKRKTLFLVSDLVSEAIAEILLLIAYLMLIKIGEMLRQSDIHGIRAVAWASIALYNLSMIKQQNSFVWEIIDFCLMVGFIFAAIDGAIRLLVSFSYKLKELRSNSEIEVANLESVIAIVTALVAIGISFVEFLQ